MENLKVNKRSAVLSLPIKIAVGLIMVFMVIVPLIIMFSRISTESISSVVSSARFPIALKNSLWTSAVATVISVSLAYLLALATVRANIPGEKLFGILLILPMLIPSLSHGMGLIILFGNNGIIKNLFSDGPSSIYGPLGIIIGSVMYTFPVAYIMLRDVLKYEDMSVYEAADVLGLGKARQFFKLSLPYMKKPLIAASFSTFSMIITDYGVPAMIGGKTQTLSLLMYKEVIGKTNFENGAVLSIFLILPAIVAFVADILNKERANTSFVKREVDTGKSRALTYVSLAFCTVVSLLVLLPILSFVILAFATKYPVDMGLTVANIAGTFAGSGLKYLLNSLLIALLAGTVGCILAYVTAYLTSRMKSAISRAIHLIVLTFMAIPGLVLGLSYLMTYTKIMKPMQYFIPIIIIVTVNIAHFIASPYLMMYNSFGKMNENLEAVGQTLGIGRVRMIKDVFLPQNLGSLCEMFSYIFVNCMMTISAVSFLASTLTKPISLMITQFETQSQFEYAAVVSLIILVINIAVKLGIELIKDRLEKRKSV